LHAQNTRIIHIIINDAPTGKRSVGLKEKKGNMKMKKIAKKMAQTIAKNWNEANELIAKSSIYSL